MKPYLKGTTMNNTPIIKHYQKRSVIIEAAKFPATPAESMEVTD